MEADTKKKRGRPDVFSTYCANPDVARATNQAVWQDVEKRAQTNTFFATHGWDIIEECGSDTKQYFWTNKGNWKAKGIAEQIGRMYLQNGFDRESCHRVALHAIEFLKEGYTVKQIEAWIRHGRNTNEW